MKLIIAIIQNEYIKNILYKLMDENIRTTKLASTGGFLKSGNTTLLIGVEEDRLDDVVQIIEENCESKKVKAGDGAVEVGGANLFILDMDRYVRI